jgi:phenylpyruvate tautomerase PptA (4-oxalocrotonate tautomerase family)
MPLVTVTLRKPKCREFKTHLLDSFYASLLEAGFHEQDRFYRILELETENFGYDPNFPDVATRRDDNFVMIEVLLGVGNSVRIKKQIVNGTVSRLSKHGFDPENVMIVFQDVSWENWSPAGGRVPHG